MALCNQFLYQTAFQQGEYNRAVAREACNTIQCIAIKSFTIWVLILLNIETVENFLLFILIYSYHSTALKGTYNMPLLELVYNPTRFGENQLVSITTWFSQYSAPVSISWSSHILPVLYFFLLFLLPWSAQVYTHHERVEMLVDWTINFRPWLAENGNVCDLTVPNINPLTCFFDSIHSTHSLPLFKRKFPKAAIHQATLKKLPDREEKKNVFQN